MNFVPCLAAHTKITTGVLGRKSNRPAIIINFITAAMPYLVPVINLAAGSYHK
jgi:hypothetical protein